MSNFKTTLPGQALLLVFIFVMAFTVAGAQSKENRPSPPETTEGKIGNVNVVIDYSSPAVKNRKIWGGEVPYDKVWRAGANEATVISFDKDVVIEGKPLPAGKYSLFTIPGESEWTVIFSKETGQWGTQYDESQDALRVTVDPDEADEFHERLKYKIEDGDEVSLVWENMKVSFDVEPAR